MEKISLNNIYLIVGIVLGLLNIYQFFMNKSEKSFTKSLVRSWQNHIEGIKNSLLQISQTPGHNLTKEGLSSSIQVLTQQAVALDKAMTEERFYKDSEVKKKREEIEKQFKELLTPKKDN